MTSHLATLESEAAQRAKDAHDSGYREGLSAGMARASDLVRPVVDRLAEATENIVTTRTESLRQAEKDMVRLAVEIAKRILNRELNTDPRAVEGLVRVALDKLQSEKVLRARVFPEQEELLRSCLKDRKSATQIEIVPDPSLERGGVVFETSRSCLDATLATQLQEIELGLADRLKRI